MEVGIGIDIGGTHLSAVAIAPREIMTEFTRQCSAQESPGSCVLESLILQRSHRKVTDRSVSVVVDLIVECVQEIYDKLQAQGKSFIIMGVGLGVPGNVDPVSGSTRYLPNFAWLDPVPLRALILQKMPRCFDNCTLRVEMRNDGRCAALSESAFGAGRGSKVFSMLTLGTGIGGALVVNGVLFDGAHFDAGDFGHHVMRSGEGALDCVCGKKGCFERHASAVGLVTQYRMLTAQDVRSGDDARGHDALSILQKMRAGSDPLAAQAWATYIDDLSTGLANLVTFYNPDVIALGGGLGQAPELYEGNLMANLVDAKSLPASRGKLRIIPADLGTESGAVGAALLGLGVGISSTT